mmetsp:Transcript_75705/g.244997  ORF Transcript_75705/g.244997 Transcript_75705/m.244997 type:complete len:326 (+) Transcript_75705:85-1062(+)
MATSLAFPTSIGPFTMGSVNLARAFTAFYRRFQEYPRPDPTGDENIMAGLDLTAAGWSSFAEIVFCQLSPLHPVTLESEAKDAANIPRSAAHFAWASPAVIDEAVLRSTTRSHPAEAAFLTYGGYIYFDDRREVVGTNSIVPAQLGTPGLTFGRAQVLPGNVEETLTRQGRFQEITLAELRSQGAVEFAWIRPAEFSDRVASPNGCFAYKFDGTAPKYFPVVDQPVFTPDLLAEDLDETEAWAVIRGVRPEVERFAILDKATSWEENAAKCAQAGGSDVLIAAACLGIARESGTGPKMTYDDWQRSAEQGSLSDPWVFFELSEAK